MTDTKTQDNNNTIDEATFTTARITGIGGDGHVVAELIRQEQPEKTGISIA